jgi:hypothetical protein
MQETFWLAENYSTSFSGNTSFLGVSEFYPLTPITANVLNARDFFHHWGSKIKKLASRRTEHRSNTGIAGSTPSQDMDVYPLGVVMLKKFNQTYSES